MCSDVIDSDWFDPTNQEAKAKRDLVNKQVVLDMIAFLNEHKNGIAIMDSTNPTHARRESLHKTVCDDKLVLYHTVVLIYAHPFICLPVYRSNNRPAPRSCLSKSSMRM